MAAKVLNFSNTLRVCFFAILICGQLSCIPFTYAATEYSQYLAHIFQKYGSGDTIPFEGLEHLMYNLGLGGIEFEPQHTIDEHHVQSVTNSLTTNFPTTDNEPKSTNIAVNQAENNDDGDAVEKRDVKATAQNFARRNDPLTKVPLELNNDGDAGNSDVLINDRNSAEKGLLLEFRELHDPRHRHPREKADNFELPLPKLSENVCLSPQNVLRLVVNHDDFHKRKLYKTVKQQSTASAEVLSAHEKHDPDAEYNEFINNVHLTPMEFMKLCPALLAQIDQRVCVRPAPLKHAAADTKQELWNAWIYASASIFILSACGLLGIALVPLMETMAYQEILKFLVAVAVGTLSGDALMHLLPHALVQEHGQEDEHASRGHGHSGGHGHDNTAVWICACAFATAVFMYMLEHLLPLLRGQSGTHHGHGHGHSHGHAHKHHDKKIEHQHNPHHTHHHDGVGVKVANLPTSVIVDPAKATTTIPIDANVLANNQSSVDLKEIKELNVMLNETKLDKKSPKSKPLTPVAFMVIVGDGLHNLTDGLAIGAAFASDPVTGLATAFAVLCHELPHELGDFALLLQTGVSIRRAMVLNIVSSVLSFLGMAIGLLIAGMHSNMTQWIYAGTAGSFLYIAFADLIPAMNEDGKRDLKSVLLQISGIIVGGVIMIIIAVNEEHLEELFK